MAVLRQQAFPLADYPVGQVNFGPLNIRPQDRALYVEVRRCTSADPTIWPAPETTLEISLEISFDNGANWQPAGAATYVGGIRTALNGAEIPISTLLVPLGSGPQRDIRGIIGIADPLGRPLRTEGFIELRD